MCRLILLVLVTALATSWAHADNLVVSNEQLVDPSSPPPYFVLKTNEQLYYCVREHKCPQGCSKADILLVVDTSNSVIEHYDVMRQHLMDFVTNNLFQVGPDAVSFAALSFGSGVLVVFDFNEGQDMNGVLSYIRSFQKMHGSTSTHKALYRAHQAFTRSDFLYARVAAEDVAKIVVVITDGQATMSDRTESAAAELLKVEGINVFAVGIGDDVNSTQLHQIASTGSNVYQRKSFNELGSALSSLAASVCTNAST